MSSNGTISDQHEPVRLTADSPMPPEALRRFGYSAASHDPDPDVRPLPPGLRKPPARRVGEEPVPPARHVETPPVPAKPEAPKLPLPPPSYPTYQPVAPPKKDDPKAEEVSAEMPALEPTPEPPLVDHDSEDTVDTTDNTVHEAEPDQQPADDTSASPATSTEAGESSDRPPPWWKQLRFTRPELRKPLWPQGLLERARRSNKTDDDQSDQDAYGHAFDVEPWEDSEDEEPEGEFRKPLVGTIASGLLLLALMTVWPYLLVTTSLHWVADLILAVSLVLFGASAGWGIYKHHLGIHVEHPRLRMVEERMLEYPRTAAILIGAIFGGLIGQWYYLSMQTEVVDEWHVLKSAFFGALIGLLVAAFVLASLKQQEDRLVSDDQRDVEVEKNNIFKTSYVRDLWVLTQDEVKLLYWARPPWIVGLILCGNGLILCALSLWAILHFPGGLELLEALGQRQSVGAWMVLAFIVVPCIFLSLYSFREKPMQTDEKEKAEPKQLKILKWTVTLHPSYLFVLGLVPVILALWWLDWPIVGWAYRQIQNDPYRLGWLAFIPATVWTLARAAYYWGSFIGVTNERLWIGSTGILLGANVSASMYREEMTNTFDYPPLAGRLLGYVKSKRESKGEMDQEFRNLRVVRGKVFRQYVGKHRTQ